MAEIEKEQSLENLMRQGQTGDQRAYAALFHALTPLLRAFVARRLGANGDVEDVVQNVLLSIHRAGHTYDSDRPFKIWMFAIARHRLNDYLRDLYRRNALATVSLEAAGGEKVTDDVTADRETREYLNMMLDTLPARQKTIILMMKIEGRSAQDVANALNMSVSAVKVAAHRAYKTLALTAEGME